MDKFFKSRTGSVLISVIWGLGIAALFKQVCKGDNCIIIKGPDPKVIRNNIYGHNDGCVQFEPYIVPCKGESKVPDIKQLPYSNYLDDYGYEKYIYGQYRGEYDISKHQPYGPPGYYKFSNYYNRTYI